MDSSHHEANTAVQQKDGEQDADPVNNSNSVTVKAMDSEDANVSLESPVLKTVITSFTSEMETNKSVTCLLQESKDPACEKIASPSKSFVKGDVLMDESADVLCEKRNEGTEETREESKTEGTEETSKQLEPGGSEENTDQLKTEGTTKQLETEGTEEITKLLGTECSEEITQQLETGGTEETTKQLETEGKGETTQLVETEGTEVTTKRLETEGTEETMKQLATKGTVETTKQLETEGTEETLKHLATEGTVETTKQLETEGKEGTTKLVETGSTGETRKLVVTGSTGETTKLIETGGLGETTKLLETESKGDTTKLAETGSTGETTRLLETEGKASPDKVRTPIFEDEPVVGDSSKSTGNIDTSNEEGSASGPPVVIGDDPREPFSPYSDKEVDPNEEKVLMIDESEAAISESAANVLHTSSGILGSDNINKPPSSAKDLTEKACIVVEGSTNEAVSIEAHTPIKSGLSSIEESIERCIANFSCESSEEMSDRQSGTQSPVIIPKRKRPAGGIKLPEAEKFPYNYGFKIITNKINLSASPRGSFTTVPKSQERSSTPPRNNSVKRIKTQGKSLLDYTPQPVVGEGSKVQESADKEESLPKVLPQLKINFQKGRVEQSEKVTPKERPAIGLKVRDVESINAAIRTVKTPLSQVPRDEVNNMPNSSAIEKGLPDEEITSQANEKSIEKGPEGISIVCKSSLRAIAPKCEPIASNDQQAIKMIRELIQLPSVPVYVPDVSDSKHFNGRLHLCHGCGDRFVLLKSLLEHRNRRSCVFKFQCIKCDSAVLCFFNRCEFIRHLYNHNQTLTTLMLQYHIAVERLPPQNAGIFDVRICQECKVILKIPLFDHMQCPESAGKKAVDLALKCQWCSLLLPTLCAYQAHRRMHFLQAPHVCPECGDTSPDLPSFNVHINSVCFHTSKRSRFQCTHCKVEVYDARKLEKHVREKHIRDVFKCNFCFVACFNLKDLEKHRKHNHGEKVAEEPEDHDPSGLKYAFHLCDMCPNRLIRRVRLGHHVLNHTYSHAEITYVYECRKCKASFSSKDVLSAHVSNCFSGSPNAQMLTSVVTNDTDTLAQQPLTAASDSRVPVFFETQLPVTDSRPAETPGDFTETVMIPTSYPEEDDDMMVIDGADVPPPLQKAPVSQQIGQPVTEQIVQPATQQIVQSVTQLVKHLVIPTITQPSKKDAPVPEKKKKKKKKARKKSPNKTSAEVDDSLTGEQGFNSFEQELFFDGNSLDPGEDAMEVVLNCLECGTNLTSELGSYCTLCEQKREAGDCYKTASPNPLAASPNPLIASPNPLTASPKPLPTAASKSLPTAASKSLLTVTKKKPPKKLPGGNYSCRICNALISKTCDKAAIKRHFISRHKEIFIAALQTGINAKRNGETLSREELFSKMGKPNTPLPESTGTSHDGIPAKKSPIAYLSKLSPKKKKKKPRRPLIESDTDDEDSSYVTTSPTREGKKTKRKKNYSPAFPALEQGMVALDDKSAETIENMRTCYKCSFKSMDKEEFMTHVATHKVNPKDLQCPACGMCFVVRPSLEKHLLILHGIQNVEEYLLEHGFPRVAKMPEDVDVDMLDVNQCKVCHLKFDSEALLEKHFRTHGSAFLLSKQFRRSS